MANEARIVQMLIIPRMNGHRLCVVCRRFFLFRDREDSIKIDGTWMYEDDCPLVQLVDVPTTDADPLQQCGKKLSPTYITEYEVCLDCYFSHDRPCRIGVEIDIFFHPMRIDTMDGMGCGCIGAMCTCGKREELKREQAIDGHDEETRVAMMCEEPEFVPLGHH